MSPWILLRTSSLSGITNPYPSRCMVRRPKTWFFDGFEIGIMNFSASAINFPRRTMSASRSFNSCRPSPLIRSSRTSCLYPADCRGWRSIFLSISASESIAMVVVPESPSQLDSARLFRDCRRIFQLAIYNSRQSPRRIRCLLRHRLAVLCMLLLESVLLAQTAPKRTLINAGHLLDVKSGRILANQQIVIEGDKIVSVGAATNPPAGAEVINLPNSTVLPGLIDAHTHLTGDNTKLGYEGLGVSIPREALKGAKNAKITLEAGFTTVRN